jgi:hypothetical protein
MKNKETLEEAAEIDLTNLHWEDAYWADLFERAKELHKQEQDEFAIGFAEWVEYSCWKIESDRYLYEDDQFSTKELLEIYKKEKGL